MNTKNRLISCIACLSICVSFGLGWFVGQHGKQDFGKKLAFLQQRFLSQAETSINDFSVALDALISSEDSVTLAEKLGYAKCVAMYTHNTLIEYYRQSKSGQSSQLNIHGISVTELSITCDYFNYIRLYLQSLEPGSADWNNQIALLSDVYRDLYQDELMGREYTLDFIVSQCVEAQNSQSYLSIREWVTNLLIVSD